MNEIVKILDTAGFLVNPFSFVWTEQGLKQIFELEDQERVAGVDSRGDLSLESIEFQRAQPGDATHVVTDGPEVTLSASARIFTLDSIKEASALLNGELLSTISSMEVLASGHTNEKDVTVSIGSRSITIDEKLAYVLGTQVRAQKLVDRVNIDNLNPAMSTYVAGLCHEIISSNGLGGKVYYAQGLTRIRVDSRPLADLARDVSQSSVPRLVRTHNLSVLRSFVCGALDMMIIENPNLVPSTYIRLSHNNDYFRRFLNSALSVFGVSAAFCVIEEGYVSTYFNPSALRSLGLKFVRTFRNADLKDLSIRRTTYRKIKEIFSTTSSFSQVTCSEPHWSIATDLVPLQKWKA